MNFGGKLLSGFLAKIGVRLARNVYTRNFDAMTMRSHDGETSGVKNLKCRKLETFIAPD